jgi:hypothetical protein
MSTQEIYTMLKSLFPYFFAAMHSLFDMAFQNQIHAIVDSHIFKQLSTLVPIFSFLLGI